MQTAHQTAHPAKLASIFSGMTDEEIDAMSPDDFADALVAQMEAREPLLTCEDMDEIEAMWERQRCSRRAALGLLTKPWAWLNQQVTENRDFAVCVAQIKECADTIGLYKGMAEFMEAASVWGMVALAGREDMSEILAEAKATMGD